jgi:hypothetical protein
MLIRIQKLPSRELGFHLFALFIAERFHRIRQRGFDRLRAHGDQCDQEITG